MTSHHHTVFNEELFCDAMITHYQELLRRRMKGWRFVTASFAWKKVKYYQQLKEQLQEQKSMSNFLNNNNHGQSTNTPVAG